jgi:TIR domain-containing protein
MASIAEIAADPPARSESGKLRVFISYSRDDLDFADQLDIALRLLGFETSLDRHAISGGEEWRQRLGNLIREADTVVFVLSPSSAASDICDWEVEEAVRFQKRVIPVVCRALGGASPPPQLRSLNYIFFYPEPKSPGSGFGSGTARLVEALRTDLEWLREHTRLLLRAGEWANGGKAESRLLSGSDIVAAKTWAARRPTDAPVPTELHLEFIRASEQVEDARLTAQRQQLEEMTAAQDERAKALRAAEQALTRTIRLQRRQAWAGAVIVAVLAIIGWWAYGVISDQRAVAREAAREDIRGQIVAYAAAFGSEEMDVAEGRLTSPYTTPLVQKLRQKKNLMEAIVDAHQQVLDDSRGTQRPLLSTSMNGQIYLHQQPATRRKRVLAVSAADPGRGAPALKGPPHDVAAIVTTLIEAGFSKSDILVLDNPDRKQIEEAIDNITQALRQPSGSGRRAGLAPASLIRTGLTLAQEIPPQDNTLVLFFFSGHGLQVGEKDYIIPRLPGHGDLKAEDVESLAVSLSSLLQMLERAAAASVVILDTHFPNVSASPTR